MARISVTSTVTTIATGVSQGTATVGKAVIVKNRAANGDVFLEVGNTAEGAALSTANGYLLTAGDSVSVNLVDENLYGIVATTTVIVDVLASKKG